MDSHIDSVSRLEVVETGRRRRWSDAEKLRIVAESMAGRRLVAATARRHGISRWQLHTWRRQAREGTLVAQATDVAAPAFAAVTVAPEATDAPASPSGPTPGAAALPSSPPPTPSEPAIASDRVEIVLANGRRLVVSVAVDAAGLARLVAVLERA